MFIGNNRSSFHLWWKKNFVKHPKVSEYYETDCRCVWFWQKFFKTKHTYFSNSKQRVKINGRYSTWSEILFQVAQGSILGPLLFNYFICDLLYFLEDFDIANYADDSTACCACKSVELVVNNLEQLSSILFEWLYNNYMKLNTV